MPRLADYYRRPIIIPRHEGWGIVEIGGGMGTGKSMTATGLAINEVLLDNYDPASIVSNLAFPYLGVKQSLNSEIEAWLSTMVSEQRHDTLLIVDEIDSLYSHGDSADKKQKKTVLNVWQTLKLGNTIIYTKHEGLGVDKVIRDATIISVIPKLVKADDTIYLNILDGRYLEVYEMELTPASWIRKNYSRWQGVW